VRSHGTTIGVLLLVLRGGFDHTATDMLGESALRLACESVTTALTNPESWEVAGFPEELAPWAESLAALDLSYRMILDGSRVVSDTPFDDLSLLNVGVSDAWFHWSQLGFTTRHDKSSKASVNGPVVWMFGGPKELTTRMLLECASIIDEGAMLGLTMQVAPDVGDMYLMSLLGADGSPLHWARLLAKRDVSIHELMALIDFALNPPVACLDARDAKNEWTEFYPPLRFVTAARTLTAHTLPFAQTRTGDSLLDSLAALESYTSLRLGIYDFLSPTPDFRAAFAVVGNHYGVRFHVARQLHALRRSHPEAVAHYGWTVSSSESELSIAILEDRLSDSPTLSAALDAHFMCIDGRYLSTPTGQSISTPYIVSAAMFCGVREIINGSSLGTSHIPSSLLVDPSFKERVDELVESSTGRKGWLSLR
jgi:hypothetical protein